MRHADAIVFGIYAANKLVNNLGHVAGCLDASGVFNMRRQKRSPVIAPAVPVLV